MIKLFHCLTDTNIGGAGMWVRNFCLSFDRKALDVSVLLPGGAAMKPIIENLGVRVIEVENIADQSFSVKGISRFKEIFKREKPDIVHTHAGLSARIAAKQLGIKVVSSRHCLEDKKNFPKNIVYRAINNPLSDIFIGVSESVCENLLRDGVPKKKLRLVYNGSMPLDAKSDSEIKALRQNLGFTDENVVVGITARLESVKNHRLFIDAASIAADKDKNLRFLIIGEGSLKDELTAFAREKLGDKCRFLGYQKDISCAMGAVDINALTSEHEALSLSLIEGFSLKKCAVTTDSGGTREVVQDGVSGFVTKNHDAKAFAEKLLCLSSDAELRKKMGEAGFEVSSDKFGLQKMADSLIKIYGEVLK